MPPKIRIGNNHVHLPRSRTVRIAIGLVLIAGGLAGFLPVLGFWMIPVGVLVLSVDLPLLRRWRRQAQVWWERRRRPRNNASREARPRDETGRRAA